MDLPEGLLALLRQPSSCYLATLMADGAPHVTQTWVDTDGRHILINSVQRFQKIRNIERDKRVALAISEAGNPARYYAVRGHVVDVTPVGAIDHIERLSYRYLGTPYPWFKGRDQTHLILTIEAQRIVLID